MRIVPTTLVVFAAFLCAPSWGVEYSERSWTDDEGKSVEAKLLRLSGSTAILDQDGKIVRAPVNRLSDADQEWIKKVRELNRWREWTMLDGSKRRLKFEDKQGDDVTLKKGSETLDVTLDQLSDADRELLATVFDTTPVTRPAFGNPMAGGSLTGGTAAGEVREWTNVNGKKIQAEYRGTEGEKIVLFFQNREWRVPLAQFSSTDQDWVAQHSAPSASDNPFTPSGPSQVASAGGNGFDSTRNAIQGRMNPGLNSGDSEERELSGAELMQHAAMARNDEIRRQQEQSHEDHAQRAKEQFAEMRRQQEERMAQQEQERQERLASASSNSMNPSHGYSPPLASSSSPVGHASSYGSGQPKFASRNKGPNAFGMIVMLLGMLMAFVGGIWLMIVALQESVLWLLACWFIPFASLVFVATHSDKAGRPFLINICGLGIIFLGAFLGGVYS